jgi:two-component system chemotaxis response regulator CheB
MAVPGVVLIGVSTGGPRTLEEILPALPADFPFPVLVAQHMPSSFTGVFARRMDSACALEVREVDAPMPLSAGCVYIGRGDADIVLERRLGRVVVNSVPSDETLWHPSADRLVATAMQVLPPAQLMGVLLTGIGHDGAATMAELRKSGGRTIAESQDSAVVFGMPAERVAGQLQAWARRGR